MELHESWNKKADEFASMVYGESAYLQGCSDFQTKALEELSKYYNTNGIIAEAIEIIKNLKAD